jgi:hypothetical protein
LRGVNIDFVGYLGLLKEHLVNLIGIVVRIALVLIN